jgi:hypothetical protein
MSVLTVIKKIGSKVLSIVEWPFVHSVMLAKLLRDTLKDTPATRDAIVKTVQAVEVLGPDAVNAIAEHGFDVAEDLKCVAEIKALFVILRDELFPAIEQECVDIKNDLQMASADPAPAPAIPAALPDAPAPAVFATVAD